jgi:O-antigen/teichoic acid export membrane protein
LPTQKDSGTSRNRTQTIAVNSLWYGSETLVGFVLLFATSIPIARTLGPETLGYYSYIGWLTGLSTYLGSLGIPAMTVKYMAEHLGRDEHHIVRAIFFRSLRLQAILSVVATAIAVGVLLIWGDPRYKLVSVLQILSVFPAMLSFIPSMANFAQQRMSANFASSLASSGIYLIGVMLSLWLDWGLVGVASSFLLGKLAELVIRIIPCMARMRQFPPGEIPPAVKKQMTGFAFKEIGLLLVGLIVWDRSDVFLLNMRNSDLRQITFFSTVFNLSEKLLMLPRVFSGALSASVLVEYGREKSRLREMTVAGTRYMLLMGVPLLTGVALISPAMIQVMYGPRYLPAIPVMSTAAIFAMFKAVYDPANSAVTANNRQGLALFFVIGSGAINIGIDWWLIPKHGAMGAAIGNGVAQAVLVISYWTLCKVLFDIDFDYPALLKIATAAACMAPAVLACTHWLPPFWALLTGSLSGALIFVSVLSLTSFFGVEDYERLTHLGKLLPEKIRPQFRAVLNWLIPAGLAAQCSLQETGSA